MSAQIVQQIEDRRNGRHRTLSIAKSALIQGGVMIAVFSGDPGRSGVLEVDFTREEAALVATDVLKAVGVDVEVEDLMELLPKPAAGTVQLKRGDFVVIQEADNAVWRGKIAQVQSVRPPWAHDVGAYSVLLRLSDGRQSTFRRSVLSDPIEVHESTRTVTTWTAKETFE